MGSLVGRMLRAAKLEVDLYEEVEADRGATLQAAAVVLMSALAAGIGTFPLGGLEGVIVQTLLVLFFWYVWAFLTYFIGTRFLPEEETEADHGELLRTVGFASAPGVLRVLELIPGATLIVSLGIALWMLVAMVIAVRQALDYQSTGRAVIVCIIGWVLYVAIQSPILALLD